MRPSEELGQEWSEAAAWMFAGCALVIGLIVGFCLGGIFA